jgi:uncharacterized protein (TIGR02246 family)
MFGSIVVRTAWAVSQAVPAQVARSEIEAINEKWDDAFNSNDAAALAALYTVDAKLLPSTTAIISGKDDIQKFWEKVFQRGFGDHQIDIIDLRSSGNWVYQVSHWTVTGPRNNGERVRYEGKLVSVLEKQPDGTWKARLHIWNNGPYQIEAS